MNMLMRLQEAANYSSPQSYDSDSNSNSHHDDILDSSLESTLWCDNSRSGLFPMLHLLPCLEDIITKPWRSLVFSPAGHLSIRAARTIETLFRPFCFSPNHPLFSLKYGCRQPSWCFWIVFLFSLIIRTALLCFCSFRHCCELTCLRHWIHVFFPYQQLH